MCCRLYAMEVAICNNCLNRPAFVDHVIKRQNLCKAPLFLKVWALGDII